MPRHNSNTRTDMVNIGPSTELIPLPTNDTPDQRSLTDALRHNKRGFQMKTHSNIRINHRISLWLIMAIFAPVMALGMGAIYGSTLAAIPSSLAQPANTGGLS